MVIQKYFDEIKDVIDRFSATHVVLDAIVNFDIRPGDQGYMNGRIYFSDESILYFKEFLDATDGKIDKLMYVYHYQDSDNRLIFRYDNALHKPKLPFREHKHISGQILKASAPKLVEVIEEIFVQKGWA